MALGARRGLDFKDIRKIVIQAVFSDEVLAEHVVLTGGNALDIVLNLVSRGSIDVDLSTPASFDNTDELSQRLSSALTDRFDAHGLVVFDFDLQEVPPGLSLDPTPWWGGYRVTFKLLPRARYIALRGRPEKAQIEALPVAPDQTRSFKIDISKHEFCSAKELRNLGGFPIWLYTPAMLAIEKFRAICQQMPEYAVLVNKRPRGRDFYDIHAIVTKVPVDLSTTANMDLYRACFQAKRVPLVLLSKIHEPSVRAYHQLDWQRVKSSVLGKMPAEFDFYFNFVARIASGLKPLWEE